MKSYKVVEFGKPLEKVEEANPTPQGSEVLVRVTAAGVCHSDVHLWEGYFDMGGGNKYSTEKTMAPPRTMGHEIVGVVEALGPEAKGAKVGDKAVVYPWIGCGKCWYCQSGIEHLCPTPRALGVNKDGGYADHVVVPHRGGLQQISAAEQLGDRAIRDLGLRRKQPVYEQETGASTHRASDSTAAEYRVSLSECAMLTRAFPLCRR